MLEVINDFLSGKVLIVLIVGLGSYFTIRSRFVQLRHFFHMFAVFRDSLKSSAGQLSSFQALMLSLAGRVGAGNIAGVGIAVTLGGPGAVFWMWVTALVGMSSSFFECSLGQLYKRCDSDGTYRGGPSYYIQHGLQKRWLGMIMAFLLLVTFGFAFNGLQSHAVTHSLNNAFGLDTTYTGLALAVLLGLVFIGGIKRIAKVADLLVPVKTLVYIGVTIYVIVLQFDHVPAHADDHRQKRLRSRPGLRRPDRQRHRHGREARRVRQRSRPGQCAKRGRCRVGRAPGVTRRGSGVQRVPRHLRDLHLHRVADPALGLLHPRLRRRRHCPDPELAGCRGR